LLKRGSGCGTVIILNIITGVPPNSRVVEVPGEIETTERGIDGETEGRRHGSFVVLLALGVW